MASLGPTTVFGALLKTMGSAGIGWRDSRVLGVVEPDAEHVAGPAQLRPDTRALEVVHRQVPDASFQLVPKPVEPSGGEESGVELVDDRADVERTAFGQDSGAFGTGRADAQELHR